MGTKLVATTLFVGLLVSSPALGQSAASRLPIPICQNCAALEEKVDKLGQDVASLNGKVQLLLEQPNTPFEVNISGPELGQNPALAHGYFPAGISPNTVSQNICRDLGYQPDKTTIAGLVLIAKGASAVQNSGYVTRIYCRR